MIVLTPPARDTSPVFFIVMLYAVIAYASFNVQKYAHGSPTPSISSTLHAKNYILMTFYNIFSLPVIFASNFIVEEFLDSTLHNPSQNHDSNNLYTHLVFDPIQLRQTRNSIEGSGNILTENELSCNCNFGVCELPLTLENQNFCITCENSYSLVNETCIRSKCKTSEKYLADEQTCVSLDNFQRYNSEITWAKAWVDSYSDSSSNEFLALENELGGVLEYVIPKLSNLVLNKVANKNVRKKKRSVSSDGDSGDNSGLAVDYSVTLSGLKAENLTSYFDERLNSRSQFLTQVGITEIRYLEKDLSKRIDVLGTDDDTFCQRVIERSENSENEMNSCDRTVFEIEEISNFFGIVTETDVLTVPNLQSVLDQMEKITRITNLPALQIIDDRIFEKISKIQKTLEMITSKSSSLNLQNDVTITSPNSLIKVTIKTTTDFLFGEETYEKKIAFVSSGNINIDVIVPEEMIETCENVVFTEFSYANHIPGMFESSVGVDTCREVSNSGSVAQIIFKHVRNSSEYECAVFGESDWETVGVNTTFVDVDRVL